MSNSKNMFDAIKTDDNVKLKNEFDKGIREKISGILDTKKKEISKSMFEDVTNEVKTSVEVSVRDALKAQDLVHDLFRSSEYEMSGSNTFVFYNENDAEDFKIELEKQNLEFTN